MKTKFILFSLLISSLSALSQDAEFINLNTDWVRMNPAYSGSNKGFRTQVNTGGSNNALPMRQFGISSDLYLKSITSGLAISVNDLSLNNGVLKETSLALAYSKHISLLSNKIELIPALQVAGLNKSLDVNALNFGDPLDPRWSMPYGSGLISSGKVALDINTGVLLDLKNGFVVGLAAHHINKPDVGLNGYFRLPQKFVIHASYDKVINEKKTINFFGYASTQDGIHALKLQAAMVVFKHLYIGAGAGLSNNYYISSAVFGYKGNFWNASFLLGSNYFSASKFYSNSSQLSLAATIREKEQRRNLTALHAW